MVAEVIWTGTFLILKGQQQDGFGDLLLLRMTSKDLKTYLFWSKVSRYRFHLLITYSSALGGDTEKVTISDFILQSENFNALFSILNTAGSMDY